MTYSKVWVAILLTGIALVHIGALRNGFYWDDVPCIVEGHEIRSFGSLPSLFAHETWHNVDLGKRAPEADIDTYRPMLNVSYLIDYQLWGLRPMGFHASNLIFHLANTLLVFAILGRFLSMPYALLAAALFGFHPLASESIHYVSARADSLMVFFALLATWLGFRKKELSLMTGIGMAFSYLLSAMVKETGLLFPMVWIVGFGIREKWRWSRVWGRAAPLLWAVVFYWGLRMHALGTAKAVKDSAQLKEIFLNFPRFVGHFVLSFLVPIFNMPMQYFSVIRPPAPLLAWIAAASFFLLMTALCLGAYRAKSIFGIPLAWLLLALFPPFFAISITGDTSPRYFYGALPASAFLVALLAQDRKVLTYLLIGATLGLAIQSHAVAGYYRTEETFYRSILKLTPGHLGAKYDLANTLVRSGRIPEAIPIYREILQRSPSNHLSRNNLGVALLRSGDAREALSEFQQAITLQPTLVRYYFNAALAYEALHNIHQRNEVLRHAVSLDPAYPSLRTKLSELCRERPMTIPSSLCINGVKAEGD